MTRLMILVAALSSVALAQPDYSALEARLPGLRDRLESLDPRRSLDYLELGEEVAAEAFGADERRLAITLLALAFDRARRSPEPGSIPSSAALALADITAEPNTREWLRSLAVSLQDTAPVSGARPARETGGVDATALQAARILAMLRAGNGNAAKRLLRDDPTRRLLERFRRIAIPQGGSLLQVLDDQADFWPCPECRNDRIVRERVNDEIRTRLCNTCGGSPGWAPDPATFRGVLRLESRLLRGVQTSWSAQLALDRGEPLRDLDPEALPGLLGVDVSRVRFDAGEWRP